MQRIYTISPMVYSESLPKTNSAPDIILNHFYLFKVYHSSELMVRIYMNYIDSWFDSAFSKLGLRIIHYDFPDDIIVSSGKMEEYINSHYCLEGTENEIHLEDELQVISYHNYLLGDMDVMINSYAIYDTINLLELGAGLFENDDKIMEILFLSEYVLSPKNKFRSTIHSLIERILFYRKAAVALANGCYESYDSKYIDEDYFILYQLLVFVESEMKGEKENEYDLCR